MQVAIQQHHFPKTSSSLTSCLSGLITLQLMPCFPPPLPSFLFLFCSQSLRWFEILAQWRNNQPSFTFWKLVSLVAVVILTNSKNHSLYDKKEIKKQVNCFLQRKSIQENICSFSLLKGNFGDWIQIFSSGLAIDCNRAKVIKIINFIRLLVFLKVLQRTWNNE